MGLKAIGDFLEEKVAHYNNQAFIVDDPVALPHAFTKRQDIEIVGLFAALMARGQRKTILNKGYELLERMDHEPHRFVIGHQPHDLAVFDDFVHRTLLPTDVKGLLGFLQQHYQAYNTMEALFLPADDEGAYDQPLLEQGLINFHKSLSHYSDMPARSLKHIATPEKRSACKRLNMFLRWMVRADDKGVDFGLWERIPSSALFAPLDVHVARVARHLGLLKRKQTDWYAVKALTASLRALDPVDPVKYDFALFGLGVEGFANQTRTNTPQQGKSA